MFWILLAAGILRLASLGWGLPGTTGWDDDGVAPRDFLFGVYKTYAPGSFYTYPPLHLILLTTLTIPAWVPVLLSAKSFAQSDMVAAFLQVPIMTILAIVARLVSAAMSLATIVLVGKMGEVIGGRRAGLFAASACALNAGLTYYGQVTNLDGPYLFWCSLSLWQWMRLIAEHDIRRARWALLFAGMGVATKDQAYAVFLLSIPAAITLWFMSDAWPRQHARELFMSLVVWLMAALALLLLLDGAITNPIGFEHRIEFLIGPASRGYASYVAGWHGVSQLLRDAWRLAPNHLPLIAIYLGIGGIVLRATTRSGNPSLDVAAAIPLLAILSFTITFNLVAFRVESRFLLPQTVLLSVYVGLFVDWVLSRDPLSVRLAAWTFVVSVAAYALYQCIGIDEAFLHDPRYDAERWLASNVRPGDTIETYGDNVYLPRFPERASVVRVDEGSLAGRNPVFHATDLHDKFSAVENRRPQFIVVSGRWVSTFLLDLPVDPGQKLPLDQLAVTRNGQGREYFRRLFAGRLAYRQAHFSAYSSDWWPTPSVYESLAQKIYVFRRKP
jgi:hypothetical protein